MDRQQIALKLAMDGVGLNVRMSDFHDRLILQKAVYLIQAAGVHLGYHFRWYIKGPYCSDLADDGFCVAAELTSGDNQSSGWALDQASQKVLANIKPVFQNSGGEDERRALAMRLELLASVHFLACPKQTTDIKAKEITNLLRKYGKLFDEKQVKEAIDDLRRFSLFN